MPNPLVPQDVLSKLRGSVGLVQFPQLNVTAPFLGEEGISIAFEGDTSGYLGTLTGAVPSPNPYQIANVSIPLLKSQALANLWKGQLEQNTTVGDASITTDSPTLEDYLLSNCTLLGVADLNFAGRTADYMVRLKGIYYINASLFT